MQPIMNNRSSIAAGSPLGFTLIEMVIVMVMIAIIAAIVYPSYQYAIRKTKRAEGRAALMQLMQQQERYYSQHTTYLEFSSNTSGGDAKFFKWYSADTPKGSAYDISGSACPGQKIQVCIKLAAKPGTEQVNSAYSDPECGILTFTSAGVKSADAKHCW